MFDVCCLLCVVVNCLLCVVRVLFVVLSLLVALACSSLLVVWC